MINNLKINEIAIKRRVTNAGNCTNSCKKSVGRNRRRR